MSQIRTIKGTHDILPGETDRWQFLEKIIYDIGSMFGYQEIRTPIFEETKLFSRSVGEDTDIVSKEMYSWKDRDGTDLTLRPELTAPVVRSFIQHSLGTSAPVQRLYSAESDRKRDANVSFTSLGLRHLDLETQNRMPKLLLLHGKFYLN